MKRPSASCGQESTRGHDERDPALDSTFIERATFERARFDRPSTLGALGGPMDHRRVERGPGGSRRVDAVERIEPGRARCRVRSQGPLCRAVGGRGTRRPGHRGRPVILRSQRAVGCSAGLARVGADRPGGAGATGATTVSVTLRKIDQPVPLCRRLADATYRWAFCTLRSWGDRWTRSRSTRSRSELSPI